MKKHMIIPIFVPHLGCPFDCIFCNQKKISGAKQEMDKAKVHEQIQSYLSSSKGIPHIEIAFYGGSFTGITPDLQRAYLEIATEYVHKYNLDGIRLSTRPDMISTEILDILKEYPVIAIELGVQSMCDDVLKASTRGHSKNDVYEASKLIKSYQFSLGLQMMLGLPLDTPEKSLTTADEIIAIGPNMVRIYPTLVIKDTELANLHSQGLYTPFTLDDTIDLCVTLTERFEVADIDVLRIGLQTTEQISPDADLIAGPYHPALRQLVTEKRWINYILQYININYPINYNKPILLKGNQKMYQLFIGHKKAHLTLWQNSKRTIQLELKQDLPIHTIMIDQTYHENFTQI